MSNVITVQDGTGDSTTPALVLGYETTRMSRNIVHDTLDGGIAVSIIPPRPRSGILRLFYVTEADADTAAALLARPSTFLLESDERTSINMTFVVDSDTTLALDDDTRDLWIVDAGYQEIVP